MANMAIVGIPALVGSYDNYIWILHQTTDKQAGAWVIDPGESAQVIKYLQQQQLSLKGILITHRHFDHVDGVAALKEFAPQAKVFGPKQTPLELIESRLVEGDEVELYTNYQLKVLGTPGHTEDHISYYNDQHLFCADTLFTAGCGRILGGTTAEYAESIVKLRQLPDNLAFYCAHEYTRDNLDFACLVDPNNTRLQERSQHFAIDYPLQLQTAPSKLELEKQTNPFMRFDQEPLKSWLVSQGAEESNDSLFSTLRSIKDRYDQFGLESIQDCLLKSHQP